MKIYILMKRTNHEGEEVINVFESKKDATLVQKVLEMNKPYCITYRVTEWDIVNNSDDLLQAEAGKVSNDRNIAGRDI